MVLVPASQPADERPFLFNGSVFLVSDCFFLALSHQWLGFHLSHSKFVTFSRGSENGQVSNKGRILSKHSPCNVDPGLLNPGLLIWGCPRFWWGLITFGGEHPHSNIPGFINPGSTLSGFPWCLGLEWIRT